MKRLFERPCLCCDRAASTVLCRACARRFVRIGKPKHFDLLFAEEGIYLYDYAEPEIQRLLFLLKGRGLPEAVGWFAASMARAVPLFPASFCALCHLPRRRTQVRRCGFDQSRLLARAVAAITGIEAKALLSRRGFSRSQHGLSRELRVQNTAGRFAAKAVPHGDILLIDDIVTTGASVQEAARVLLQAGAARVFVLCVAKGGQI